MILREKLWNQPKLDQNWEMESFCEHQNIPISGLEHLLSWQPTPVFLPGKSHGQRSLAVHGVRGVGHNLATKPTKD